ncbi:MAG: amidohydrolase [Acidimicrobiia bacterium]|jgi:amidohydrolase
MPGPESLAGLVEELTPRAIELRRLLHQHPEPANREYRTTELVQRFLAHEGIALNVRAAGTGGWVDIGDAPLYGFRADLDGLPIVEPEDNEPRSGVNGWMHACGHDAHTAIAASLAVILSRLDLPGGVRILFQPAEESNPGGAADLVEEGLVDGMRGLIAFHVDPTLRAGRIGARTGPITASSDSLTIALHGPGGHTSRPHKTVNIVEAAGRVATELPTAIRSTIDARSPIVTVFGSIHGGDAANVVPTEVTLRGTVRTLDPALWDVMQSLIDKSLGSILAVTGAGYTLDYRQGIGPVVNDEGIVTRVTRAMDSALGSGTVVGTEVSMGGEDFSDFLAVTPGALFRLGSASGGGDLHSSSFKLNEDSISVGIHAGAIALLALLDQ